MTGVLYIIALLAIIGVFTPHLDDTIVQRIGLSLVCIGALGMSAWCTGNDIPEPMAVLLCGVVLFMIATAYKLLMNYRRAKNGRRRVTDRLMGM